MVNSLKLLTLKFLGACLASSPSITNAIGPTGEDYLEGDSQTYSCSGEYSWTDLTTDDKEVTCSTNGSWSSISELCKSLLFDFQTNFPCKILLAGFRPRN